MTPAEFLPGVPVEYVLQRFALAGGNEVESGKLSSPESSAALAANCFAWFRQRPHLLPPFDGLNVNWPATSVDIEYCARFPWSGGRHPWLDAMITTQTEIIGVESKRFEPFRGAKRASLSEAYDRPVWGEHMAQFEQMRDDLRSGRLVFKYLDATQLVKHALGLLTEGQRLRKRPVLVYLFAEPKMLAGRSIGLEMHDAHVEEVRMFAERVARAEVTFHHASYARWLEDWSGDEHVSSHARQLLEQFDL